jgi:tetratricopeptide (TPR) repeat protein/transglutaminase-like putative cysteine protease
LKHIPFFIILLVYAMVKIFWGFGMMGMDLAVVASSESVGRMFGVLLLLIGSFAGIIKCISISRRKTTSGLCVVGLMLALVGFVIGGILVLLRRADASSAFFSALWDLGGLVRLCMAQTGLVLSIVGLSLYRRSFSSEGVRRDYAQGKKQAIWGIVLNSFFILIFFGHVVVGALRPHLKRVAMQAREATQYTEYDYNFKLSFSDRAWVKMNAGAMSPDATIMLVRSHPKTYFAVFAEKAGVELNLDVNQLVEVSKSNMKAVGQNPEFSEAVIYSRNGIEGQRFDADVTLGTVRLSYVVWVISHNGYCYQVMAWSSYQDKKVLLNQADEILSSFCLIDPARKFFANGTREFGKQVSWDYGYVMDLQDSDWLLWDTVHDEDVLVDCGGILPDGTKCTVLAAMLPHKGVTVEVMQKTLLNLYGIETAPPSKAVELDGAPGLSYAFSNENSSGFEKIYLGANCAYMVSVWRPAGQEDGLEEVAQRVFNGFSINPQQKLPSSRSIPDDRKPVVANLLNQVGLSLCENGKYEDALKWFESASEFSNTNVTFFGNILAAHNEMGEYTAGLKIIQDAPARFRDTDVIRSWEACFLVREGMVDQADEVYQALFSSDYRDDDDFVAWTRLRAENGLWEGMDELFEAYTGTNPDPNIQAHQLGLYFDKGDFEKVINLTDQFMSGTRFSPNLAYWKIDGLQAQGQFKEALEVCEELIGKGYATVSAYQEKGYCEYQLDWHRQAKASYEAALKLNPRNEQTKEWVDALSAELGEGSNGGLTEVIAPVELPQEYERELHAVAPEGFGEQYGAYYERLMTLWSYRKNEELKRTSVYNIRVLDDAGVASLSSLSYPFNPVYEHIFVNELIVRDADGKMVGRGAPKDYYLRDDDSDGMETEKKNLIVPVPRLQPGCSIEAVVTQTYSSPPDEFYFEQCFLAAGFPILNAAAYLSGDVSEVKVLCANGVQEFRNAGNVFCKGAGPYEYKWEPFQLPAERFLPVVTLGTSDASWNTCGKTYLEKIKERLVSSQKVRTQALELTKDCTSDEDKFAAVIHWVRSSFTYKPLEFGRSGYMPDTAADTMGYQYGDCKDLSVLVKALLETVGIECKLVLVHTVNTLYPEIVTSDQFDHMIVYLPTVRGGLFVDPTDQEAAALQAVPNGLGKQMALVLDPEQSQLMQVPDYKHDSNRSIIYRTIDLEENGRLLIEDKVVLCGYAASWMRSMLKGCQKVQWVERHQQLLADFIQGLQVKTVSARYIGDTDKDLELNLTYTYDISADAETITVPPIWLRFYVSPTKVQERKNPFRIYYPFKMELKVKSTTSQLTLREKAEDNRFMEWKALGDGTFSCQRKRGEFEADEYEDFVEAMSQCLEGAKIYLTRSTPLDEPSGTASQE